VFVQPERWSETDESSGDTNVEGHRTLLFMISIFVRDDDPERRYNRLDLIGQTVQNAINGVALAGFSLLPNTRIREGRYVTLAPPMSALIMRGSADYLIGGYAGHDTTNAIDGLDP
jgi:hypothetical protein